MQKKSLRIKYKELRAQLSDEEIENFSLDIANQLLQLDIWGHTNYHLFLSIEKQKEVQTNFIMHILQGKDKNIIVSKSNFSDNSMLHFLLTDNTILKINDYGIPEPDESGIKIMETQLDVVFVPLLVVDTYGNRIGYGKGFYDRFLKKCRPNTLKIGLSFFEPISDKIDTIDDDVPLDMMICPDKTHYFR